MMATDQLTLKQPLILGTVLVAVSVFGLWVALFRSDLVRRHSWLRFRWGRAGEGAPLSRVGAVACAIALGLFGALTILKGCYDLMPDELALLIFSGAFVLVIFAGIHDTRQHRRKKRNPRLSHRVESTSPSQRSKF